MGLQNKDPKFALRTEKVIRTEGKNCEIGTRKKVKYLQQVIGIFKTVTTKIQDKLIKFKWACFYPLYVQKAPNLGMISSKINT